MDFKVWHSGINSSPSTVFYRRKGFMKRRLNYYLNCSASFNPIMVTAIRSGDIHPHPGPVSHSASTSTRKNFCPEIKCLYMNARSLVNKSAEFQSLAADLDLIAVTETWLKPHILDCEILPGLDFSIHRRDRKDKTGGGVMLAVKNSIQTLRRKDLEGDAEIVLCELRPEARRKILAVVFYRPPNSNLDHLKELKKSLRHASQLNFDQIIICGDFNLPDIDWSTGIASSSESLHNYFTKFVKDNYLWQLVHFPTRNNNILDLILTNIPDKIHNLHGYDDIISTDHKLIGFDLDLRVPKKPDIKLLKMTANIFAPSLCQIYNLSLYQGVVPACWKLANVTPVFKKDDPTLASNYRPISLLSIISKTFERCVYNHCYPHISPRFYHLQHGFLRGKSTVTQLLHVYQEILDHLAGGKEVDAIHLDLSKAFDRVQHHMLLNNYGVQLLNNYGVYNVVLHTAVFVDY